MKNILITGGAGFMGSTMIHFLLSQTSDISIINLDKLTYAGNLANLQDIENDKRYAFIRGDISDQRLVESICANQTIECVLNYAAETHVDRSILDPKAFLTTDMIGTFTLLEAVRKFHIPKMIQISTDEVYGSIENGLFSETSPFQPNSPYAASKAGGDHLCRAYFKTYQTPVIVTHSCNFYGPFQYPEKFIPLFVTNLLEGKKVPLYGDGLQTREWIFTHDHCKAIKEIMERGQLGEAYNIGSGDRKTNLEITKKILGRLSKDESMIERATDRPGHDRRYAIDSSKLRQEIGWEPSMPFDQGLDETIAWYVNNKNWWKPLKSGEFLKYYQKQYQRS